MIHLLLPEAKLRRFSHYLDLALSHLTLHPLTPLTIVLFITLFLQLRRIQFTHKTNRLQLLLGPKCLALFLASKSLRSRILFISLFFVFFCMRHFDFLVCLLVFLDDGVFGVYWFSLGEEQVNFCICPSRGGVIAAILSYLFCHEPFHPLYEFEVILVLGLSQLFYLNMLRNTSMILLMPSLWKEVCSILKLWIKSTSR